MTERPVTFLKPDFAVVGGFELLADRCVDALRRRGYDVRVHTFRAYEAPATLAGLPFPEALWPVHPDYFLYAANVERVEGLRLPEDHVVVATQPPSYLLDHPRLVNLTYHQARIFYDLHDAYVGAGHIDPDLHALAAEQVRAIDRHRLPDGARWLAGSAEVASRLDQWWGVTVDGLFTARSQEPPDPLIADRHDPAGPALCVSRHAWPKRTELVVLAAACDPGGSYELVGGGGRQPYVEALAARYAGDPAGARDLDDTTIWLNQGDPNAVLGRPASAAHNVVIHGFCERGAVVDAYERAGVVIAPAHREDYGLTVLEAFTFGRPVVVCSDGGGLVELVEDTGAGLVVEPRPDAIAAAVRSLRQDPARLSAMAAAAIEVAMELHRRDDIADLADVIDAAAA